MGELLRGDDVVSERGLTVRITDLKCLAMAVTVTWSKPLFVAGDGLSRGIPDPPNVFPTY